MVLLWRNLLSWTNTPLAICLSTTPSSLVSVEQLSRDHPDSSRSAFDDGSKTTWRPGWRAASKKLDHEGCAGKRNKGNRSRADRTKGLHDAVGEQRPTCLPVG